jgi:hypothetical protein
MIHGLHPFHINPLFAGRVHCYFDPGKDEYRRTIPSKIREFCKEYTSIISFFSGAPKQLGYLRVKQKKVSKVVALLAAGNTRWGTQVSIFCIFTSSLITVVIASIDQIPSQEQRSPSNVLLRHPRRSPSANNRPHS